MGERQIGLQELFESPVRKKAKGMYEDVSHSLAKYFDLLANDLVFHIVIHNVSKPLRTFVPQAIILMNL